MKIIIAGCGKIGAAIVESLVAEGHDVTAVDRSETVISEIANIHDTMGIVGNCADCEVLTEAGAEDAALFVAATGSDETNMLACFLARRLGAAHTIARIRDPEYNDKSLGFLRQQLDLSMSINPERLTARELFNMLRVPSAVKIETFSRGSFEMIELRIKEDSPLAGKRLMQLREKYKAKFLICVVQRGKDVYIPDGNFVLAPGDRIGLSASHAEIGKLFKAMGAAQKQARSVMILGGSRVAYYLAKMLTASGSAVKIIERDKALCDSICADIPKAVVINGDGAQQELLLEEGVQSTDAFAALTGMDEENILIAIFAQSQNVPKVLAKISRDELLPMSENLGLETVVSPRRIVADLLVRYARALHNASGSKVETLYRLMDDRVEALEFNVGADFKALGVPLRALALKPGVLIAGILRDRKPIIPSGDDAIFAGDKVVVIAANRRVDDLADILK